jgi:hypothetical protein
MGALPDSGRVSTCDFYYIWVTFAILEITMSMFRPAKAKTVREYLAAVLSFF